jgi:hypothetical protein
MVGDRDRERFDERDRVRDRGDRDRFIDRCDDRDRGREQDRAMGGGRGKRPQRHRDDSASEASNSGPEGVPKRSEAIRKARRAFEDAEWEHRAAFEEYGPLKAQLQKKEKMAEKAVARRVAEVERRAKDGLADELDKAVSESERSLSDALVRSETDLQEELKTKICELKAEYAEKGVDEKLAIKNEHADKFGALEKSLREAHDKQVEEERDAVEQEELPGELRKRHEALVERVRGKEKDMLAARRRLEDLTGRRVNGCNPRANGVVSEYSYSPERAPIERPPLRRPREG